MRVLLDTNIIVQRESNYVSDYSIASLYKWLDKLHYIKTIHPGTIQEISKHKDAEFVKSLHLKLASYQELVISERYDDQYKLIIKKYSHRESDEIDNSILYQVYIGRVNYLITEDKLIHKKAKDLSIDNKVFSINSFITFCRDKYPDLTDYKNLPIEKVKLGHLDFNDVFFQSFKEDYVEFQQWLEDKSQEEVYVAKEAGNIVGLIFIKIENQHEQYNNINPRFPPMKRLKIRTFKVEATGLRLGERMLKIAFDNAKINSVEEIYLTLFDHSEKLITLKDFLKKWGFIEYGLKTTSNGNEIVMVKKMNAYNVDEDPRYNYPLLKDHTRKFILPIEPQFHTDLFPESILMTEEASSYFSAHRFAVQKIYISGADPSSVNPGDLLVIYRKGDKWPKKFSSVVTTIAIVDDIVYPRSVDEMISICSNRSVFKKEEIRSFWPQYNKIIKLLELKPLKYRINLDKMQQRGIIDVPYGPRPFHQLSNDDFSWIITESNTSL